MICVVIEFKKMIEKGEMTAPDFETESVLETELLVLPRFKDQIKWDGKKYVVWDVVHDLMVGKKYSGQKVHIMATRRVCHGV